MEEDRSKKFSPSKLDCYKNCPRRYQYRYIDRISRARKTPETAVGVAVHAAFEELYELVRGGRVPTVEEVLAAYEKAFEEEWTGEIPLRDERFGREDWRAVGRTCVADYHAAHAPFTEDKTVGVEVRVGFPLEVEGHEYRIEGFVDRLALAPDGAFEIHDYKTAKSLSKQEHADADWQLALYELAVRRDWPDAPAVRLKWHYVRHGKTLTSVRSPEARDALRAEAAALIARIKHDHDFAPAPGPLCDWCEYKDLCPVFAHPVAVAALPKPQRREDAGVKLVDALVEIEARRKKLKDELKSADGEKAKVEAELADFAVEKGLKVVAGERAQASVTVKEDWHLPTKTAEPERHADLEKEARASAPLWAEVSRLDGHALIEGVRARKWPEALLALAESLLARYARRETVRTVRLKRRVDPDDE